MLKIKIILDCYLYKHIKLHYKLSLRATKYSNKSNNVKYKKLTNRNELVDETLYSIFLRISCLERGGSDKFLT